VKSLTLARLPAPSYTPEGQLLPPAKSKKATPADCADRVKRIFTSSDPLTAHFKERNFSICLHSDMEGAVENVKAVKAMIDSLNEEMR
jgi:lactam utilization protein B